MYFFSSPHTSMLIREYTPADLEALRRMHASQGFDYAFPNLDDPIFISKLIVEDDSGRPVMASLARLTCEMYLLIDSDAAAPHSAGVSPAFLTFADNPKIRQQDAGATKGRVAARQRWMQLLALHRAGEQDLLARGLDDAHAWLPRQIARRFGRRLESLGWLRDDSWTPYCKRLKPST